MSSRTWPRRRDRSVATPIVVPCQNVVAPRRSVASWLLVVARRRSVASRLLVVAPRRSVASWLLVIVAVVATGCSRFIDDRAADSTYRILASSQIAARRLPDVELAADAMPGGLVQLEAFALAYPRHSGFRKLHAEAICQYAVAFVFDSWEDAQLAGRTDEQARIADRLRTLLELCTQSNVRLLPAAWRGDPAAHLASATRAHAQPLLWIASANSVRIALDPPRAVALLKPTLAMLERVAALAPGFHDADAELLLGTLRAATHTFLGGPDGRAWFAAARKALGDGALLVDVLEARVLGAAGRPLLERVRDADLSAWPERRLANELARKRARRYLDAELRTQAARD